MSARRPGRPPTGPKGEKRSEMRHQIAARVPTDSYALLRALVSVTGQSQADVLSAALLALQDTLPPEQQRLVKGLLRHGAKR